MDVLFSNRSTRDKAVAREFYTYYSFRRPVFYILLVLMTIVALIWFAKKGKEVNTEIDYESMS